MNALADPPQSLLIDSNGHAINDNAVPGGELVTSARYQVAARPMPTATPAYLLQLAVEQGADLDKLERLMALQERWEANEAEKALNDAFANFKAEAVRIVKTKEIKDGPLKGKKHAVCAEIIDATTPALSKYGLATSWRITKDTKDLIEVTARLKHRLGGVDTVSFSAAPDVGPGRNAIQARSSAVTYLERITLTAVLGLSAHENDDDGNGGPIVRGDDAPRDQGRAEPESASARTGGDRDSPRRDTRATYPADRFADNLPEWRKVIKEGRKTADQLIAWLSSKHPLTEQQEQELRAA